LHTSCHLSVESINICNNVDTASCDVLQYAMNLVFIIYCSAQETQAEDDGLDLCVLSDVWCLM